MPLPEPASDVAAVTKVPKIPVAKFLAAVSNWNN